MLDDLLRQWPWIFAALFGQDEGGIGLVIAETRVGRGRDFTRKRKPGRGEGALQFPA